MEGPKNVEISPKMKTNRGLALRAGGGGSKISVGLALNVRILNFDSPLKPYSYVDIDFFFSLVKSIANSIIGQLQLNIEEKTLKTSNYP